MKILSFSLDNSILDKSSALTRRILGYGSLVEKYTIIVPNKKNKKIELSDKITIYGSGGNNKLAQLFEICNLAKKLLVNGKHDIITVQDQYYLALIALILSKKFKIGLELQIHGFEKYYGLRKIIARYVLPRAKAVRCVSQRLKKELVMVGVAEEKITVVPIFTEIKYGVQRVKEEREDGKLIFLTVGRLVPVKNIGLQIDAMREVVKKYPQVELWIVGDGSERKKYEPNEKIKFFGWQDDLKKYYSQADAFLLTSNAEGWGLAVIEAAGYGLPIIMTDVGCAGEVIKNNESGIIVPVGDKEKVVEGMLKVIENKDLRERFGENAKSAVSRLPGKEQILDLYKKSWEKAVV